MIAGCRIDAVVSRGPTWTVYRATHLQLDRPVAVTVLAPGPELADAYRGRFTRAVELAATVDHPSLLAASEWGEIDGTFYLLTRWIDGAALSTVLASRGPLAELDTVITLRPVVSALAAAHRQGLAHGDVASRHVVIADRDDGRSAGVYLTGFGIAQLNHGTATPAADISAFGRLVLETLRGSAPDQPEIEAARDRPARDLVRKDSSQVGIGDRLAGVISRALATDPAAGFASADEVVLALERARAAARAEPLAPGQHRAGPPLPVEPAARPAGALPDRVDVKPRDAERHHLAQVVAAVAAVVAAVVLIVALATYGGPPQAAHRGGRAKSSTPRGRITPTHPLATVALGQLSVGREIRLGAAVDGLSVTPSGVVWASVPARSALVEVTANHSPVTFHAINDAGTIAAGAAGVWVTDPAANSVALFAGGRLGNPVELPGRPVAIALDRSDGSAWVADGAGGISHVGLRRGSSPVAARLATTHLSPPATGIAVGEPNWVWAVDGSLVRTDPASLQSHTLAVGSGAVDVTVNGGIWMAHTDGRVTRFDPRPGHENLTADVMTHAPLSHIAARERAPLVWAISGKQRSLYEIPVANPRIIGAVRFTSPPTGVAITHRGVWISTADGWLIRIER
jgi:hypothetical protein